MKPSTDEQMIDLLAQCGRGIKQEIATHYGVAYNVLHELISGKRQNANAKTRDQWRERIVMYCNFKLQGKKARAFGYAAGLNGLRKANPYFREAAVLWAAWEDGYADGITEYNEAKKNT